VVGGKESVTDLGFFVARGICYLFFKGGHEEFRPLFFSGWSLSPVSLNLFWTIDNQTDIV
jgi:hypothetical protein